MVLTCTGRRRCKKHLLTSLLLGNVMLAHVFIYVILKKSCLIVKGTVCTRNENFVIALKSLICFVYHSYKSECGDWIKKILIVVICKTVNYGAAKRF